MQALMPMRNVQLHAGISALAHLLWTERELVMMQDRHHPLSEQDKVCSKNMMSESSCTLQLGLCQQPTVSLHTLRDQQH